MADQNITALPIATTPESSDQLLLVGATEEKLIDYDKLADAILGKIASKNFALDQGNKTLLQALNELNSKAFELEKHAVTNGKLIESSSGPKLLNESIDTGFKFSNNILPLRFECTDRAGWMPVIWTYPTFSKNYLVYFGEGAQGEFKGTLHYIKIK